MSAGQLRWSKDPRPETEKIAVRVTTRLMRIQRR